jgi:EF-P beta-lysylation protein EpmB
MKERSGFKRIISRREDLASALEIDRDDGALREIDRSSFPLMVPASFVSRVDRRNQNDPILRQFLPSAEEGDSYPDFQLDPVGDVEHLVAPGLIHKYPSRALLITTGSCSIHCRYCFRRNFSYSEHALKGEADLDAVCSYLAARPAIKELILSGGDPLTLSTRRLQHILKRISSINSLLLIRIHSRNPIVAPESISDELVSALKSSGLPISIVLHCNHANEIDSAVGLVVSRLREACPIIMNQAVLLRGVNDNIQDLIGLSYALAQIGVVPYYLNLLDRANGTGHFEVSEGVARALMSSLRDELPGYLVPRLVRDVGGGLSKSVLL